VSVCDTPTNLLRYSAPISNDQVTMTFKQAIGANEALRTGTYSKTLTFTLATTTPVACRDLRRARDRRALRV